MENSGLIHSKKFSLIVLGFGAVLAAIVISFVKSESMTIASPISTKVIDYRQLDAMQPTDKIKVFFNKDVDHSYRTGNARKANGNADFTTIIVQKVTSAQKTIDLAVMYLEDKEILQALKEADLRGVKIRIITDFERFEKLENEFLNTGVKVIDNNGGKVEDGYNNEKSIMHYKFGIFDHEDPKASYLIASSANWTPNDFLTNANNLLVIQDQGLVKAYFEEFEQMWSGKFNRDKDLLLHKGDIFEIDGRIIELWMSPAPDPFMSFQTRYLNLLSQAKKSIYFAPFNFTLSRLSQELEKKFVEGLDVKGIGNDGSWDINGSVFFDMRGVEHLRGFTPWKKIPFENIRHDALEGKSAFHYKYFLIDDRITFTGAGNPTVSSIFTNDEDVLIIHDPLIANEFKQNFFAHFKKYGGTTKDSLVKITNFDDENDSLTIRNLTENTLILNDWKLVAVDGVYIADELSPKRKFTISDLEIKPGGELTIALPEDFLTDNNKADEFPLTNSYDDGEVYLFDNFALLQHMVWY